VTYPEKLPPQEEATSRVAAERDSFDAALDEAGVSEETRENIAAQLANRPDGNNPEEFQAWVSETRASLPDDEAVQDAFEDLVIAIVISILTENPVPAVNAAIAFIMCALFDECEGGGGGNGERTRQARDDDENGESGPKRPESLPIHPDSEVQDGVSFKIAEKAGGTYLLIVEGDVPTPFAKLGSCADQLSGAQIMDYEFATREDDYTSLTFFQEGEKRVLLVEYYDRDSDVLSPESFDAGRGVRISLLGAEEDPGAGEEIHTCDF
jgi:hypothetical protein